MGHRTQLLRVQSGLPCCLNMSIGESVAHKTVYSVPSSFDKYIYIYMLPHASFGFICHLQVVSHGTIAFI